MAQYSGESGVDSAGDWVVGGYSGGVGVVSRGQGCASNALGEEPKKIIQQLIISFPHLVIGVLGGLRWGLVFWCRLRPLL
jgi:hypothetical protein